jgi:uncharacterized protein YciI
VKFDRFTVALLVKPADAPVLGEREAAALQDAHMSHLADLHDAGLLLAAGPLLDQRYRGLSILRTEPEETLALKRRDPAVRAGLYTIEAFPWLVPGGAVAFAAAHFPRSIAEANEG